MEPTQSFVSTPFIKQYPRFPACSYSPQSSLGTYLRSSASAKLITFGRNVLRNQGILTNRYSSDIAFDYSFKKTWHRIYSGILSKVREEGVCFLRQESPPLPTMNRLNRSVTITSIRCKEEAEPRVLRVLPKYLGKVNRYLLSENTGFSLILSPAHSGMRALDGSRELAIRLINSRFTMVSASTPDSVDTYLSLLRLPVIIQVLKTLSRVSYDPRYT